MKGLAVMAAMCAGAAGQAQEYAVKSFEIAPDDLTARMATTSRVDANGRKCAVVKVYVDDRIAALRGPYVGEVAGAGMEKWVYLSHDAKFVELVFDHHYPLRINFIDYNFPTISGQMTYIVKLTEKTAAASSPSAPTDMQAVRDEIKRLYDGEDYQKCLELCRKNPDDSYSQYYIGMLYSEGKGVRRDDSEAVKWFRKAAEQGHADAQHYLGVSYHYGIGATRDYSEAVKWYHKAAEQGHAAAQYSLGYMYERGYGVPKDYSEAARWHHKAAEQGYATAQYKLGSMYENGHGVPKDYSEAVKWYRKVAEQGDENARGKIRELEVKLSTSAQTDMQAVRDEIKRLCDAGNYQKCLELCRKYPDDSNSQYYIGALYTEGKGVTQDYSEAVKWFRKAAEQGYAAAQYCLGTMYYNGLGVPEDYYESIKWYRKAAEQGYAWAQYCLGIIYEDGLGVTKDFSEAVRWYRKAADQGMQYAINQLKKLGVTY